MPSKKQQKLKAKKAKRKKAAAALLAGVEKPNKSGDAAGSAADYLVAWSQHHAGDDAAWKFNKSRQTFLLKSWPTRKMSSDVFKLFLQYAATLPTACAERTITQAREIAAKAESAEEALSTAEQPPVADDDDDDAVDGGAATSTETSAEERAEQLALLKIKRARALRLLKVLVDPVAEPAS